MKEQDATVCYNVCNGSGMCGSSNDDKGYVVRLEHIEINGIESEATVPVKLKMDNRGGRDFLNNWNMSMATRALAVRFAWIRELREEGVIDIDWIRTNDNEADLCTKNLNVDGFKKHTACFCGVEEDLESTK